MNCKSRRRDQEGTKQSPSRHQGETYLRIGLEAFAATSTAHNGLHEGEESVTVFGGLHRAYFVLGSQSRQHIIYSTRKMKLAYPISRHPLPEMLELLDERIRRQDIDDAQIIDRIHRIIRLIGRSKTTFILVEDERLPITRILLWQCNRLCPEFLRVRFSHSSSHGNGFGRFATLDSSRFATHPWDIRLQ